LYSAPSIRSWTPQEWRDKKKSSRLAVRHRRLITAEHLDLKYLSQHKGRVQQQRTIHVMKTQNNRSVAQHTGYIQRIPGHGHAQNISGPGLMSMLVGASMAVGPEWEKARLLVDSGSEHPPLISQDLADRMGLRGTLAGGATQANGEYLPLYDVGKLHLGLNGKPVSESFLSAPLSHYDVILGESWLKEHAGIMDYAHGQLWQWGDKGIRPMTFDIPPPPLPPERNSMLFRENPRSAPDTDRLTIDPLTIKSI